MLAAKFEDRHAFAIIAVMLHQYMRECPPLCQIGQGMGQVIIPKKLNGKTIEVLIEDIAPLAKVDFALRQFLSTYQVPPNDKSREKLSEVSTALANLFFD